MTVSRLILHPALLVSLLICSSLESPTESRYNTSPYATRWVVEKNSRLSVAGKSNVNEFQCAIMGYYQADTILCTDEAAGKPVKLNGCLELDISRFDCNSRMITSDLRKTLKAEQYPQLVIRFLTLERMPSFQGKAQRMKGWVEIGIAGVNRTLQINYDFIKTEQSSFVLNGQKTFCFSDFKLHPPKKLAGMIQIRDNFDVLFQLQMRMLK